MFQKKSIFVRRILHLKMKFNTLFLITSIVILSSCNEQKETSNATSGETNEVTDSEKDTLTPLEMINPDGSINATLNCSGSSELTSLVLGSDEISTENFKCSVAQIDALTISFEDEAKGMTLTISLFGAGSLPIKTGKYGNQTIGSDQFATAFFQNKNGEDVDLGAFGGYITIVDYGMSSNILCGEFEISDINGNLFSGTFNETVLSF